MSPHTRPLTESVHCAERKFTFDGPEFTMNELLAFTRDTATVRWLKSAIVGDECPSCRWLVRVQ